MDNIAICGVAIWGVGMTSYIVYKIKFEGHRKRLVLFNVTDRVIKNKRYKSSLNDRAKGAFNVK